MDISKYSHLWENYDNVLVKTKLGYSIVDKVKFTMIAIENEKIEAEIIRKMLQNGNPIYESIKVLKENGNPINIVGSPSEADDFPVKRYKLSIQWSKNTPIVAQVKKLKIAFPVVNVKSNQELLKIAKNQERWHFDTVYLDSVKKNEILQCGKEKQLNIVIEPDDLKESF